MREAGENNAEPGDASGHRASWPDPRRTERPHPRSRGGAASLTLMMLLRRGVARTASRRPASLSAGAPAAPGSATPLRRSLHRPPGAPATPSPEAASGPTRGSSSQPAASGGAGPSLPAAPSAMAGASGSPGETARPAAESSLWARVRSGTRRRPRQTLFHRPGAAAAATFWSGDIARLQTSAGFGPGGRRSAGGRRRERERDAGGREQRRKGEGGVRNALQTPAPRQTKGTRRRAGRPRRPGRARPGGRSGGGRSRTPAARRTRHLPAERGAAAPGSAAAAAASTPLCCDREGRLVLTARGDWQAPEPLRSLASPRRGRPDQSPLRRGGPEREEWKNVCCGAEPARPGRGTRAQGAARGCAPAGAPRPL